MLRKDGESSCSGIIKRECTYNTHPVRAFRASTNSGAGKGQINIIEGE